jgi:hypothetical protein
VYRNCCSALLFWVIALCLFSYFIFVLAISPKLYCSQGDTSDSRSSSFNKLEQGSFGALLGRPGTIPASPVAQPWWNQWWVGWTVMKPCVGGSPRDQPGIHRVSIGTDPFIAGVILGTKKQECTWPGLCLRCVNAIWFFRKTPRNTLVQWFKTP